MFTDGIDNASWLSADEIMKAVQTSEAVVHVVGIRSQDRVTLSQPVGVPENGWHPLEVKVKKGKADEVRSRPGYLVQ